MTIAFNIILAVLVFAGVAGLLAFNIVASRVPSEPKSRPVKTPATPSRAYGSLSSAGV
jgi:hypothetical protein